MSIPLATIEMWAAQLVATSALLTQVNAAAASAPPTPNLGRQYGPFRIAAETFLRQQASGMPPVLPLPPPIPSFLIRPDAWQKLMGWDAQIRQWAARWRRAGADVGIMPPSPDTPPMFDPRELGLGLGTGLSFGTLAAIGIGVFLFSRR